MKEYDVQEDRGDAKTSKTDGSCLMARTTVEQFIRVCGEKNVTPSYDHFSRWMEANRTTIALQL
jgi:hypothetical protein